MSLIMRTRRTGRTLVLTAATGVALVAGITGAGTAAEAAPTSGSYTLVNAGSGLCLDAPGSSDGTQLVQSSCNGGGNQVWTLTSSGGGVTLRAGSTGKCAGVKDASTSAGKAVQLESCSGASSQTWQLTESGSDYRVVNANGGKCLNVKDSSTSSGALVQQNSCDSVTSKQWRLTPAGSTPSPTASPTATPTRTPTPTPTPTGGGGTIPAFPTPTGSVKVNATIQVSGTFDGGMKRYYGIGDGGQSESQDPMFELAPGATIKNVIIGAPAGDGVHCNGNCTIQNVWWEDVGEDAATFLGGSDYYVTGGGAKSGADKVFQHNGPGTVHISGFFVGSSGKLYRACGNCSSSYQRHVVMNNIVAQSTKVLAGINTNWGDTARFSNITVYGSSSGISICDKYKGVPKGSEPTKIGSGADGVNCIYSSSDITYK
ncbi:pectate lyase [Sphaerisporangium dianthi]|uniref:pectate lyase n=1 Tax=Sphaerisporangium dianthi TaxID=1436120 RepID=A0ABV9CMN0_9ACTN